MQKTTIGKLSGLTLALAMLSTFGMTSVAGAVEVKSTSVTRSNADNLAQVQAVITDGDAKIAQRLTTLTKLNAKIASATKLTTANKATLTAEVTSSSNGLTALKSKLDADTTLATAKADSRLIITDYRVYMLVAPKVHLVKVADDQLTKESKLATFADKLQSAAAASTQSATLSPKVADMQTKIKASQTTSLDIENKLLALKPSDYNANHALMVGYLTQLKTVQANNLAIYKQGLTVMKALGQ